MTGSWNSHHLEKFSLLVADDNATSLLVMREILTANGYQVEAVSDGYKAIAYAVANQPDLIMLNSMLPGIGGFETCRLLKANPATETIPVLFITSPANKEDIARGFEAGGADYVVKPLHGPEILGRIKTQLKVATLTSQLRSNREFQEQEVQRRTEELEAANRDMMVAHNLLQSVLDAVPEQLFVVNRNFKIIYSNNSKIYDNDLSNNPNACPTCYSRFRQMTEPCKQCAVLEVFNSGQSVEREVVSQPDGRVWRMRAFPIFDGEGKLLLALEYIREITKIKQVERENERRRQFLDSVLQEAPDAIVTLDDKHNVIDWNPGAVRMFGYHAEEARGRHLDSLVAQGTSLQEAGEKTRSVMSGKALEPFETVRQRRDGSAIHVIASGSPIIMDGVLTGAVAVYTDISEIKMTERRIQQLQKMEAIGTLAGGIAHDFNNILSAVFGYSELALLQAEGLPVLRRNLVGILEAAKRAKELVQQILLFSRQSEQEQKPLQLKPLIKEALKMLRSSLPTTIRIVTRIDGVFENVLANPTQIHQILMNLCANAAQAMEDEGGVLTVSLFQVELSEEAVRHHPGRSSGIYLKLQVEDTGRGIPADMIDKIFNPYFTTKAKGQGTGLGLSVVHGIIQRYLGIIEVHSELGVGTVFDIFLPAIHLEAASEEIMSPQLSTGSEHILLVDDEAMLIEVLGTMLSLLGYKITSTQSSFHALQLFQSNPSGFDLLITDMTMPELTGDRLTVEIRSIRPDIPVIICTGYNRRLSDHKPEALAVQAILMKPVEQIDLARTVREVLDGRNMTATLG